MSDAIKLNFEKGLFALAVVIAFAVRLFGLGSLPLSNSEAELAMQSVNLSRGQGAAVQSEPAYVLLTGGLFYLTQAGEFSARFWPAVFGAILPLAAYFMRDKIGKRPAVILAFGLALDPGLVALSRQANGAGMTLSFVLLAGSLALNGRSLLAGAFAGLALLGGSALWPGLIGIGLAVLFFRLFEGADKQPLKSLMPGLEWKKAGYSAILTGLVVGTLLMSAPSGLGGIGGGLGEYFGGWGTPATGAVSIAQLLLMLPIYHLLPFVFGLVGLLRALFEPEERLGRGMAIWFGVALLLCLAYPSRQVTGLVWVLAPLWVLAARELARVRLAWGELERTEIGYAVLVVLMTVFIGWSLARMPNPASVVEEVDRQAALLRLIAGFGLFILTFLLIVWGWGLSVAGKGLRLGVMVVLPCYLVAAAWNAAGLSGSPEAEMWRTAPLPTEANLMKTTLDDLSLWNHHTPNQLDVAVVGIDAPNLRWMLRDYPKVRFLSAIAGDDAPSIIITSAQSPLAQVSTYRGQDFIWSSTPAWQLLSPYDFIRWIVYREAVMENQSIIVWARGDLFPGAAPDPFVP